MKSARHRRRQKNSDEEQTDPWDPQRPLRKFLRLLARRISERIVERAEDALSRSRVSKPKQEDSAAPTKR